MKNRPSDDTRQQRPDLEVAAGPSDAETIARMHGLTTETVLLRTDRGGLREDFPRLYELEDVAGRIHSAARGLRS